MSCSQLLKELRATAARILRPSAASRRELVHTYVARKASLVGKRVIDEATSDWHFSDIEASRFNVRFHALFGSQCVTRPCRRMTLTARMHDQASV